MIYIVCTLRLTFDYLKIETKRNDFFLTFSSLLEVGQPTRNTKNDITIQSSDDNRLYLEELNVGNVIVSLRGLYDSHRKNIIEFERSLEHICDKRQLKCNLMG